MSAHNKRKAGVAALMSDKLDFRAKNIPKKDRIIS